MTVLFANVVKRSKKEWDVHFSTKGFLQSGEFDLAVIIQNGKVVKIESGTCIDDGWINWYECGLKEEELLDRINLLYKEELAAA